MLACHFIEVQTRFGVGQRAGSAADLKSAAQRGSRDRRPHVAANAPRTATCCHDTKSIRPRSAPASQISVNDGWSFLKLRGAPPSAGRARALTARRRRRGRPRAATSRFERPRAASSAARPPPPGARLKTSPQVKHYGLEERAIPAPARRREPACLPGHGRRTHSRGPRRHHFESRQGPEDLREL